MVDFGLIVGVAGGWRFGLCGGLLSGDCFLVSVLVGLLGFGGGLVLGVYIVIGLVVV